MKNFLFTLAALAMCFMVPGVASADDYGKSGDDMMVMGQHSMGVTVDSIDHKTGFMKLKSGMGEMIIHYPPPAVKDLKKGDKITVNLSFTTDEGKKDAGMMKMK